MDYFKKLDEKPVEDLTWNIPEKKQGKINIIGGNSQSFRAEVKVAEFLSTKYPIETLNLVLPDALKGKLPPLPNFVFLKSTDSGSFAEAEELKTALNAADFNLLIGDLSKNSVTGRAVASACGFAEKPLLITRDSVDCLAENQPERALMNENLIFLATMPQLIKIFRAVYYPKMILLSQSLVQVAETLHKFTLSYPVSIITLHSGQILLAKNGEIIAVPLEKTNYTPLSVWQGELAAKIVAMNLYNPDQFLDATISAIFSAP